MKAYVLNIIRVFGLFVNNCGTESEYILFFTANGIIKFRFDEHGPVNVVTHQQDFERSLSRC